MLNKKIMKYHENGYIEELIERYFSHSRCKNRLTVKTLLLLIIININSIIIIIHQYALEIFVIQPFPVGTSLDIEVSSVQFPHLRTNLGMGEV